MSSSTDFNSSAARDNASPAWTGSYNVFVIRHSDFVIFPLVIRAKTALVSASRFAARFRSARDHGGVSRALANTKMRNRYLLMSILALASSSMLATSSLAAEAAAAPTEHEGVPL